MNIGLDFTSIIYQRGVSRYTQNLARELAKLPQVKLTLFGYSLRKKNFLQNVANKIPNTQSKFLQLPIFIIEKLWQFGFKPVSNYVPNLDVFHSWDWLQPPDKNIPIVSTIHDLAMLKFPETAHPKILKAHQKSWKKLKQNKSHIIAVSQSTKKDIVRLLGYPSYMVHVVHEAVPQEFINISNAITQDQEDKIIQKLVLHKPYILFVGTREPRKNLIGLIEAWQPLSADYDLVIAGESGWDQTSGNKNMIKNEDTNITQQNKTNNKTEQNEFSGPLDQRTPRFLGRVTDAELSVLYANASVFAYPSFYEGFGLPILESFHHGTPVVTSNNSGMLEVAGNACELVDPDNIDSITKGIKKILNETSQEQQKRLQRMIIRQQMFSWKTTARETLAVYKQAIRDFN